jgi:hypothetical protein
VKPQRARVQHCSEGSGTANAFLFPSLAWAGFVDAINIKPPTIERFLRKLISLSRIRGFLDFIAARLPAMVQPKDTTSSFKMNVVGASP